MIFGTVHPYFATLGEEPLTVAGSVVIAVFAIYVALEFAGRVHRAPDRVAFHLWLVAGSVTMGSGIWSMHFVGMSAVTYPFHAQYGQGMTAASWVAAVAVSAVVLLLAAKPRIRPLGFVGYGIVGGIGATVMHFIGIRAMVIAPTPLTIGAWVAVATTVAAIGAALALALFHRLRVREGAARVRLQAVASIVLGSALAAMHYLAMASTVFGDGAVCVTTHGLDVDGLGKAVGFATILFLSLVSIVILLERRAEARARRIDGSLAKVREELAFVTLNDASTGLPNRIVFDDRLQQAVARCQRMGGTLAVLFAHVDHASAPDLAIDRSGTPLSRGLADALRASAGDDHTVASLGGERFLVIVEGDDPATTAMQVAERFAAALREPPLACTASIGIASFPQDGRGDDLVRHAGTALQDVRRDGGNGFRFFEASMDDDARTRGAWLTDLRHAVRAGQLELHYQPKVHADDGAFDGVEALLRWRHPVHGPVSPALFVPLAEQYGLIDELGRWVVDEAARQMRAWTDEGVAIPVAINVSTRQLRRPTLADEIVSALALHGVEPRLLTCEVTESGAMDDPVASLAIFDRLGAAGVRIAIDDFGTGHSSLSHLRRLPVSQLKIDRSFVADLDDGDDARAIVAAIVQLAHTLRLEVVAEGVETETQRHALSDLGCDKFQGWLFARAMPADALVRWLGERTGPARTVRPALVAA